MKYKKPVMTIVELKAMGYPEKYLRAIYRSRAINRDHSIAWKMGGEDKPHSTILFDTEALEKYRRTQCTGF